MLSKHTKQYQLCLSSKQLVPMNSKLRKYSKMIQELTMTSDTSSDIIPVPIDFRDLIIVHKWIGYFDEWKRYSQNAEFRAVKKLKEWEELIMSDLSPNRLVSMLEAATWLKMPDLLEGLNIFIADWIHDKTPEQLEKLFNIKKAFSEEEKAKIEEARKRYFQKKTEVTTTDALGSDACSVSGLSTPSAAGSNKGQSNE